MQIENVARRSASLSQRDRHLSSDGPCNPSLVGALPWSPRTIMASAGSANDGIHIMVSTTPNGGGGGGGGASPKRLSPFCRRKDTRAVSPSPLLRDLDAHEQLVVAEVRAALAAANVDGGAFNPSTTDIVRFLQARDWNEKAAAEMLVGHAAWRKEFQIDGILEW